MSQDNITKRAAVEKEPLTLENYYLSYPKPPVLDTMWANREECCRMGKHSKV